MPAIRLDSRDVFEYNARYGVLICRECRYAIQKSALRSHLLRHRIYRGERQRLLSSITQFELLEPHQVPLPHPASPPITSLPIISGYRCTVAGCGSLCASSKRMRRHRGEIHGLREPHSTSSSFALPVKLQTFFRGTKLRYFEVASPTVGTAGASVITNDIDADEDDGERHNEGHDVDADAATPQTNPSVPTTHPRSLLVDIDLEMLTYFHHFTTTTSLTLPGSPNTGSASHYWQTVVVLQALRHRWLMCGLLAISACHLAALAEEKAIERVHRERSVQLYSEFSAGLEQITTRDLDVVATGVVEEAKKAGGQMRCILRCAHWSLAESTPDQEITAELAALSQLQSIMTAIRSFVVPDFAPPLGGVGAGDGDRQDETFSNAKTLLEMTSSSDAGGFGVLSSGDNTRSAVLNRLRELPSCMAETFGKPESAQDFFVTMSAIAALIECCDTSFATDEVGSVWWGMATWLNKVPDHFNQMVSCHSPAALAVLAHWAASLVQRAEHCGCWFLRGLAKTILLQIAKRLEAHDSAALGLVESTME